MKYSSKILSQITVQLCKVFEVKHIVISPGSRNAPLTIGFTENPFFTNYSIVDERCAAFFALGMAQQLKKPVVLVCTSGSALLNYYPAIAEAYYSDIPLIVLSADRPKHLLEIGDGQTIKQEHVYANHILFNANCKEGNKFQSFNKNGIIKALETAIEESGPVHINLPFSEPLYEIVPSSNITIIKNYQENKVTNSWSPNDLSFLDKWNNAKKILILVGVLAPNSIEQQYIEALAQNPKIIVFTETTSNIHHRNFINSIDPFIVPLSKNEKKEIQPDILLTFGGMIVSKKIKKLLRKYPPQYHWHIDTKKAYNTFFVLNKHFKISINDFLKFVLPKSKTTRSDYQKKCLEIKSERQKKQHLFENKVPYSDFKVFSEIFKYVPTQLQLQLSNSTTIRYAQLFSSKKGIHVFCNRGTSGIDGSMSTAIGAATISKNPTLFITGDLSFFYDSNAFWNNYIPKNFKIILINNSGGGIFRILPANQDSENFDTFFETKHQLNAKHLCEMYGFNYATISSKEDLSNTLKQFLEKDFKIPSLLEIFTPSKINNLVLEDYFRFL